ncbi:MAG: polyprenyl synthetase family protein [Clostridiales bacterium]|jgi:geranylgeranyl diphosphate synthase type II|nr:polyprenyl synthetase family protein [Clostridiales bacterium]
MDNFEEFYAGLKEKFNLTLIDFFRPLEKDINENLYDAMKYSVINSGKRLRPILCMLGARFAGKDADDVMTFAIALEMIHTYSLVHDDLPAVDNDSLRRGKMTTHIMHGEAMAVFAGDALLNLAYEIMTESVLKTADFNRLRALELIMKASGAKGLLNGQAKDVDYDNSGSYFLEHIVNMYRSKTADLIRVSLVSGALIAGAKKDDLEALSSYADSLGIYFQIQDDLMDEKDDGADDILEMTVDELAEADGDISFSSMLAGAASDKADGIGSILDIAGGADDSANFFGNAKKEKMTFLKAVGREETEKALEEYEQYVRDALEPYGEKAAELISLFEYVKNRKS